MKNLRTLHQAAAELGLRDSTLRAWVLYGRIGFVRVGRKAIRFHPDEIQRVIAAGTVPARDGKHSRMKRRVTAK